MSVSTAPPIAPAPPKKKGLGCLGCGCLILSLIVLLFLGLVAGFCYLIYSKAYQLTSSKAAPIASYDGGDNFYAATKQIIDNFNNDLKNRQASQLQLGADEINTLLARDPYLVAHKIHLFVAMAGDTATVQGVFPTNENVMTQEIAPDRFANFNASFSVNLDSNGKTLHLFLSHLQSGDTLAPDSSLPFFQTEVEALLNAEIQKRPELKDLFDQAKTVAIKSGSLVLETR
jgi:hypothetical protein